MPTEKRQRKKQGRELRLAEQRAIEAKARTKRRIVGAVMVALVLALFAFLSTRGGDDDDNVTAGSTTSSTTDTTAAPGAEGPPKGTPVPAGATLTSWECPKADGSSPRTDTFPDEPPPQCIDPARTVVAKVTTTEGDIEYTLDTQRTPVTANNFAVLARYHYYDGTVISRIDESRDILQTGSPKTQTISDPGPGYDLPDEGTGFTYAEGDVAMARGAQGSSASQYFIVAGPDGATLNGVDDYINFAKVTSGMDVVKKIFGLFQPCAAADRECLGGAPSKLVTITKVEIEER